MNAIDIMSRDLIILSENTSIRDVAQTMKEKDIGFIPLSNENKITGVITDRDMRVLSRHKRFWSLFFFRYYNYDNH